jgi:hypothetical protein
MMSRDSTASGAAPNTPETSGTPPPSNQECKMPAMALSDPEVSAVAAYLETLQ